MKKLIQMINYCESYEQAQGMLKMLNAIFGTEYGLLAQRVVRFDNPHGSVSEKYAHCHDVLIEIELSE